jgi:NAD(P)-dependent dehydrogenase (short-subunit alcohol dehydrogenase family)
MTQRTAVITGATSDRGIGMAVAERYARDGWAVVVLDLDASRSAEVAARIGAEHGVPAFGTAVDVTDEASVADAQSAVAAEVGAGRLPVVGAVANIAGITSPVPFLETELALWDKVMAVNATGTYLVTKAFLPGMLEAGWGRIVNMSSVSAQRGASWPTPASPSTPSPPGPSTPTSASAPPPSSKPASPPTSPSDAPRRPQRSPA